MELESLSVPHAGIYRRGISPFNFPQAFLPTVPNLQRKISSMKDNFMTNRSVSTCSSKNDKIVRRRSRVQVGATNRCRLSEFSTGCDLLARKQMLKATQVVRRENEIYLSSLPSCSTLSSQCSRNTQQKRLTQNNSLSVTQPRRSGFAQKSFNVSLERQIAEMRLHGNYIPLERRVPTPTDIFTKIVHEFHDKKKPEIILYALDETWELCEDAIHESEILSTFLGDHKILSMKSKTASIENLTTQDSLTKSYVDEDGKTCLSLQINNPLITIEVLSIALLSLYKSLSVLPVEDVINVMVAAQLLKIPRLIQLCTDVMMSSIKVNTVGLYHKIAVEYQIPELSKECFSWLELKLVPFLSNEIYLGHVTKDLMLGVLSSPRLFVTDEYALVKVLCYWVFFNEQQITIVPSWNTVVTWFMSIPYSKPFLQTNVGRVYAAHFKLLRLNGIIDPSSMHEIQKMNLLPVHWLLSILQNHYYSLQSGGDMKLMARFENSSLRFGNVLKKNNWHHSTVVALHGFYFELTSVREEGLVKCFIKRLRPTSSLLSFRICERQTFSIRQDREIRYDIKLQWKTLNRYRFDSLGATTQVVGFNEETSQSQMLISNVPNADLFVSFILFFPPS